MTRLVGPRHVRMTTKTDGATLAVCSGLLIGSDGTYGVPHCRRNTHGCAFHYPGLYKGKHRRADLPVTTGGYGMPAGATGAPLLYLAGGFVGQRVTKVVSDDSDTPRHRFDRLDMVPLAACDQQDRDLCRSALCPVHCPVTYARLMADHRSDR